MSPSHPHMTVDEFRKEAVAIFREYFEHGDTREVSVSYIAASLSCAACIQC